jgi:hypothetical protein
MCVLLPFPDNTGKKRYRGKEYTRNNGRVVGRVDFYAVRLDSKESMQLALLRISVFLFKNISSTPE